MGCYPIGKGYNTTKRHCVCGHSAWIHFPKCDHPYCRCAGYAKCKCGGDQTGRTTEEVDS